MDNAAMGVPAGAPPAPAAPAPMPGAAPMPGDPAAMGAPMPGAVPADPNAMAAAPMPGAVPGDPNAMAAGAPMPGADPMAGTQGNGFDMGIGMTPDEDPKKWIEGAAAKLAGELRKYQEGQPKPDMELNKTAVNTIAAATKTGIQPNQKDELMSSYADAMRRDGEDGSDGSDDGSGMPDDMGGEDPMAAGGDMGADPNAAGGDMGGEEPMAAGGDMGADPNAAGGEEQVPLQEAINEFVNELFQNLKNDKRNNSPKSEIEYQKDRKSFSRKPFTPPIK